MWKDVRSIDTAGNHAWTALASVIFAALIAKGGVELLQNDPHITAVLVIGTILAAALFTGALQNR